MQTDKLPQGALGCLVLLGAQPQSLALVGEAVQSGGLESEAWCAAVHGVVKSQA